MPGNTYLSLVLPLHDVCHKYAYFRKNKNLHRNDRNDGSEVLLRTLAPRTAQD